MFLFNKSNSCFENDFHHQCFFSVRLIGTSTSNTPIRYTSSCNGTFWAKSHKNTHFHVFKRKSTNRMRTCRHLIFYEKNTQWPCGDSTSPFSSLIWKWFLNLQRRGVSGCWPAQVFINKIPLPPFLLLSIRTSWLSLPPHRYKIKLTGIIATPKLFSWWSQNLIFTKNFRTLLRWERRKLKVRYLLLLAGSR